MPIQTVREEERRVLKHGRMWSGGNGVVSAMAIASEDTAVMLRERIEVQLAAMFEPLVEKMVAVEVRTRRGAVSAAAGVLA